MISRVLCFSSLLLLGTLIASFIPAFAEKNSSEEKAGSILFRDKGCTYCHGPGGVGTTKAPSLTELWKDKTWTHEKITNQILNGGRKMPPFRESVTDEDVNNLIAYLRSKNKPVPPPVETEESTPDPSPQ